MVRTVLVILNPLAMWYQLHQTVLFPILNQSFIPFQISMRLIVCHGNVKTAVQPMVGTLRCTVLTLVMGVVVLVFKTKKQSQLQSLPVMNHNMY